jgi:hypothetical protein
MKEKVKQIRNLSCDLVSDVRGFDVSFFETGCSMSRFLLFSFHILGLVCAVENTPSMVGNKRRTVINVKFTHVSK